jgi:hypothetical protein
MDGLNSQSSNDDSAANIAHVGLESRGQTVDNPPANYLIVWTYLARPYSHLNFRRP